MEPKAHVLRHHHFLLLVILHLAITQYGARVSQCSQSCAEQCATYVMHAEDPLLRFNPKLYSVLEQPLWALSLHSAASALTPASLYLVHLCSRALRLAPTNGHLLEL
jgi:hypothetical protein